MYQACTCPQSNLTGGDPNCPVPGHPLAVVTTSWCTSCASLREELKQANDVTEALYNQMAKYKRQLKQKDERIQVLEEAVRHAPRWSLREVDSDDSEPLYDGMETDKEGIWINHLELKKLIETEGSP